MQAREVFLTKAGYGIRWVKQCAKSEYRNEISEMLYKKFIKKLLEI
jgi:hypothetical protein